MNLFEDFESVSSKQWKQQIQYELKGADYNDVVWESPEGIKVKPFYHFDEATDVIPAPARSQPFRICQEIFVHDIEKSAYRAKDSISRGAESIRFTIENPETDVYKLLFDLPLETVSVYLKLNFLSESFLTSVNNIASDNNTKIFCLIDPVGQLARNGNWFRNPAANNFDVINELSKSLNSISIISVDAALYQNAGANIVQQVAYALAHANEYLNRAENPGTFVFEVAVGSNYFFEIAKLRAIRRLFNIVSKEYATDINCHIVATPTKRNKTIYDYNVNLLRSTTECMSAILGGADAVANMPYDVLYHKSNEFGERISRNQLLIMKHESYLDKVSNAADGSYYIESLTSQIAEKALVLFKEIEANGGFIKQLGDGTIQRKIRESAEKEQQLFDDGKEVLLGTNKHPNKKDRMAHDLELYPFVKIKERKTLITPIIEKRLAEKIEQQRLESEKADGTL